MILEGLADEQRTIDMQISEPTPALRDFLSFVVEITKNREYFRALLKRQPHLFAQGFDPSRRAFVVLSSRVKLPENVGAALLVGILRQQVLDRVVDNLECVSFFRIGIAEAWFGNRELAAPLTNLVKRALNVFFF